MRYFTSSGTYSVTPAHLELADRLSMVSSAWSGGLYQKEVIRNTSVSRKPEITVVIGVVNNRGEEVRLVLEMASERESYKCLTFAELSARLCCLLVVSTRFHKHV